MNDRIGAEPQHRPGGQPPNPSVELALKLLGKTPRLVPTPSLSPVEFEDFTERLLSAQRFCSSEVRRVLRVDRWGRPGDNRTASTSQDGSAMGGPLPGNASDSTG